MANPFETSRETLKERTDVLLKSGELCDCVFIVGDSEERIVAHKVFMAISSPAFYAMFYGDIAEKSDTVRIEDIEPAAFKGMLQYIYTDKTEFESCNHACMVYLAAKKYLLPYLESQCEFYVETNVDAASACEIYEFAKFHGIQSVEAACLKLFQDCTEDVINSQSFIDSDYQTILTIVKMEWLNIDSEYLIFKAVEKWAINEANRRDITLKDLSDDMNDIISQLRFLSLTADEFTASQVNISQGLTPLLTTEEQLAIVMNITNPGIRPLPKRISTVTSPRQPKPPPPDPVEVEWSLCRECQDGALFPVTKWCNPFTRKGITVSRKIKVKGVKIGTQKRQTTCTDSMYQEKVTVILKKDWALKFYGALHHTMTPYDSEVQVNFSKPVPLEPGKLYWLIVNFDKGGTYSFLRDTNLTYQTHNTIIKMSEDLCVVTEIFFIDNENDDSPTTGESSNTVVAVPSNRLLHALLTPPPSAASTSTSNESPAKVSPSHSNCSSGSHSPTSPK